MTPALETLTAAKPAEIAEATAFALRYSGRKRVHDSAEIMASIVAKRLAEHLERSGFVVMKRPPLEGSAPVAATPRPAGTEA
jgi:hypothetical protein